MAGTADKYEWGDMYNIMKWISINSNRSPGLPQIQDFEIPDFFKTFSEPEIIFFKTANDGIL